MRTNRYSLTLILLFFSLAGLYGCDRHDRVQAAGETPEDASLSEPQFMMKATEAHLAEIEIARVAKMQSKNGEVKSYAGIVLKDHVAGLDELTKLMKEKNVPQPQTIADATRQDIARMSQLSGSEFDREFINMMVADHQKILDLFRDTGATAHDTDVQDYVDNLIPKLDKHLRKAQELQSKLFSGKARQ